MDISSLILMITIGVSIWAFSDRSLLNKLIFSPYLVDHKKEYYRCISHVFIHGDYPHLFFNMIALWSFSDSILMYISQYGNANVHFLLLYFGGAIFAVIPDLLKFKDNSSYASLGASGGISSLIFLFVLMNPWQEIFLFFIPIPAILFGVFYMWYSYYMSKKSGQNINHNAHLYGAIFGLIYPLFINVDIYNAFFSKLMKL